MSVLTGRVVLVAGGSRGIGAAVARSVAKERARVGFCYRSAHEAAQQLCTTLESLGAESRCYKTDVPDRGAGAGPRCKGGARLRAHRWPREQRQDYANGSIDRGRRGHLVHRARCQPQWCVLLYAVCGAGDTRVGER